MRTISQLSVDEVIPSVSAVLEAQGIPRFRQNNGRSTTLALEAIALYREKARPVGILMEVSKAEFANVFRGEGLNEHESPVKPICEASSQLALFAVTVGNAVCSEISHRFQTNDFALGSMLDAAASEGTEMTATAIEKLFRTHLSKAGLFRSGDGILRFSPGYCGWHISAQRKLFDVVYPGEIGIALNERYLMQPLKSITGVIVSGEKTIFNFDDTFTFCRECAEHTCRDRIQAVMDQ